LFIFNSFLADKQKSQGTKIHICSLLNINKHKAVVNTPGAFFEKYFAGARQRPRGHLAPRIQQPTLPQWVLVTLVPLHELGDAVVQVKSRIMSPLLNTLMGSPFEMARANSMGLMSG